MSAVVTRSRLADLAKRAIATDDAYSRVCGLGSTISDEEYNRADEAAFDALGTLLDHLLNEHGITRAEARQLGRVLL